MKTQKYFALLLTLSLLLILGCGLIAPASISATADVDAAPPPQAASSHCAPLPPPTGTSVTVSTVTELQNAVNSAASGDTILVADGTYNLDGVYLQFDIPNVTLRSTSGNREDVILDGNYVTEEIVQIAASNITIADLTLREAYYHPIHVMSSESGDVTGTLIYNLHIIDPGEQAIKINPYTGENALYFPDNGVVACSHIELTDAGRPHIRNDCYTGGIDAHQARDWVIRDNLIEGFWCESGLSEHGIHLWRSCRDTLVERNELRDNARGIGFGLVTSGDGVRTYADDPCPGADGGYVDHYGGIIRNNFIFVDDSGLFGSAAGFDCGICLWQACGVRVLHNTVASTQAPFSSIEWRFDYTDVDMAYNLVSHNLQDRGGTADLTGNLESQPLSLFVDGAAGDLHLAASASAAIDQAATLPDVSDDFDGDSRPQGSAPDVGADEYQESATGDEEIYLPIVTTTQGSPLPTGDLIQPEDLTYLGAFRLPGDGDDGFNWQWSNWSSTLTYYPDGDPGGGSDGYPGSLFGTGHDWNQYVSEISIPVPVNSASKTLAELNTAATLQPFADIRGGLFDGMEMPRVGLAYLPPQGSQTTGKLYFAWAPHLDEGATNPSHGWSELTLANPQTAGAWRIGESGNYVTGDYLFDIPQSWADAYVSGMSLATGRYRDGGQSGQGPAIFAIAPWQSGNPPAAGITLSATPLLLYQNVLVEHAATVNSYHHSDEWTGAAWMTAGSKSAVIFVGNKGRGDCWYGNQDGPCLDCENRGWWSTYFDGQMLFYDPADLAAVVQGIMETWEPQPYAVLNIDEFLYHITSSQQKHHLAAAAFDRTNGLLYVIEPLVDEDRSIVHVWRLDG